MTETAAPSVVDVEAVTVVRDGRVVLDVPTLAVRADEVLAVIGPNGAGKSTLLRILGLLETPATGRVRFLGQPVSPAEALDVRRRTAAVFQEPLLADATVLDNVGMGLRFRGTPRSEIVRRAAEWLERLGIAGLASRQARTLSGGEAQRTALARALVLAPDLLLLDEPFSALDQPSREALIADIGPILRRPGMATVLVTHDRAEALALADRTAVLFAGRIAQVDETLRVFRSPASEDVARFVGVETIVDGVVVSVSRDLAVVDTCSHAIRVTTPARAGEQVRLCLRPEDVAIVVGMASDGDRSARNRITGRIARIVPAGPLFRVGIECGFELHALVTRRTVEEMRLQPGSEVVAQFEASALHVLRPACLDTSPGRGV